MHLCAADDALVRFRRRTGAQFLADLSPFPAYAAARLARQANNPYFCRQAAGSSATCEARGTVKNKKNEMGKLIAILCLLLPYLNAAAQDAETLRRRLEDYTAGKKAQIGIAVIFDGKDTLCIRNESSYPMLSVFKFHQALAVARHLERGGTSPDMLLHVEKTDLKPDTYSPLKDKYPQGGIDISVKELLNYTLQLSDNNACDILFRHVAGVKETDAFVRSLGIEDFAITATEEDMHRDKQLCYENRTSPLAAACLLDLFVGSSLLGEPYRTLIRRIMTECETGKNRLPRPLTGTAAVIGHKTGTSDRNDNGQIIGTNDIGFVFLPDGRRYSIAVFVKDSEETPQDTEQIIADISAIVYRHAVQSLAEP